MPSKYKPKSDPPKISEYLIKDAIRKVQRKECSIRGAAKAIGMHESTLRDKMKTPRYKKRGGQTSLPQCSESELALLLNLKTRRGFAIGRDEVKNLVQYYVKANKNQDTDIGNYLKSYCKFTNDRPGNDWLNLFMKRTGVSLKLPSKLEKVGKIESGFQSPNSSEEAVVADPCNVINLVKEEDIKPDISTIDVSVGLSDIEHITTITDNENIEDDVIIKKEILDEQEHSWPTELICVKDEIESSDNYSGDQKIDNPINKYMLNSLNNFSTHFKAREICFITLENSEDFDKGNSRSKRKVYSNESIETNVISFSCDVCNRSFRYKGTLRKHQRIHTGEKPSPSDIFNKTYSKKHHAEVDDHKRIHTAEKPIKSEICNIRYSLRSSLNTHKRFHIGERPFSCDLCHKTFFTKFNLNDHKKIHTGERPFNCDICNKKFSRKSSMNSHKKIHTAEKPFFCDICNKKFSHKRSMDIHKRNHTGEKPFFCDICNKTFYQKSNLALHLRIHTGEKPYICEVCHKAFSNKANYIVHKRIHTGEKPYSCDICNKTFSQKESLIIHLRIHTGEKPYICKVCHKTFSSKSNFTRHERVHKFNK